jgi:F0F1-type ATP synthase membrane subunit a
LVFFTVLFYGLYKNGLKFFKIFVPSGVPLAVLPLVVFIEVLSSSSSPSRTACVCSPTCWPATSR